jgi:tetratricopeptide (TPR) repeat protein
MAPPKGLYVAALVLIIGLFTASAHAADWIKLQSPHFELFTSQSEDAGRQALAHLERLHAAFRQPAASPGEAFPPVRVILFSGFNEFGFYSPGGLAKAYYAKPRMGDPNRNFIVISGFDPESISILNHEFSHLVSFENQCRFPIWFEEGLASFYETLEFRDGQMFVGAPHEKHLKLLRNKNFPLIGLGQLFQLTYQGRRRFADDHMNALYVQGWAIVHLLSTNPKFAGRFPEFQRALAAGEPTHEALGRIYDTTAAQLREDFLLHIKQPGATAKAQPLPSTVDPSTFQRLPMQPWESRLATTELLVTLRKDVEAEKDYTDLQREFPQVPEIDEAFGAFKEECGHKAMAVRHYRSAIGKGSRNPETYLRLVTLQGTGDLNQAFSLLDETVRQQPENWNMRSSALHWALRHRRYDQGASYAGSFDTAPRQAPFEFHLAAGTAHLRARNPEEAKRFAERAKQLAADLADNGQADALLANVETALTRLHAADRVAASVGLPAHQPGNADSPAASAPEDPALNVDRSQDLAIDDQRINQTMEVFVRNRGGKVVEGTLKELRCAATEALLIVAAAEGPIAVAIDDPSNILITRRHQHQPNHDFRCGPQKAERVKVGYQPSVKGARVGFLRILEFEP